MAETASTLTKNNPEILQTFDDALGNVIDRLSGERVGERDLVEKPAKRDGNIRIYEEDYACGRAMGREGRKGRACV